MKNMTNQITEESINNFKTWLYGEERSSGTIEKYLRDIKALRGWLNGREVTKESVADWKASLQEAEYQPVTINSMLASVNTYCRYADIDCRIKFLKFEKRLDEVFVTANKNTVPGETRSPFITSGIRLGTPAVTTRGMGEEK